MEARVEAGDLRHPRKALEDRFDRRQVRRLVKRRQRFQRPQILQDLRRDHHGAGVPRPSVDDAMADAEDPAAAEVGTEPGGQGVERAPPVSDRADRLVMGEDLPRAVLRGQTGRGSYPLDLALRLQAPALAFRPAVDAELDARGAGVEDESVVVHGGHTRRRERGFARGTPVA